MSLRAVEEPHRGGSLSERATTGSCDYEIKVSEEARDQEWDSFLAKTPGGHHAQTSLWAQVKAPLGWSSVRVVVKHNADIVAGVQALLRVLRLGVSVGYVFGGPVSAPDVAPLDALVLGELQRALEARHVQYLLLQPAWQGRSVPARRHWQPVKEHLLSDVVPIATTYLNLAQDYDQILRAMRKSTRRNLKLARQSGVTVREGDGHDMHTFYRLLSATSERKKLPIFSEEYYANLWAVLRSRGHITLLLGEYGGEAVAASLVIPFGETVTDWTGAWSGTEGKAHPNELLEWAAIKWAKEQGYHYFDFDGINPVVARATLNSEPVPDTIDDGSTFFKLGFGGRVALYPRAYEYIRHPSLRWVYSFVGERIADRATMTKVANLLRGITKGS